MKSTLERLLSRKTEVWVVLLVLVLSFGAMIAFGNIAVHAYKGGTKAGVVGDAVLTLSTIPELVNKLGNTNRYMMVEEGRHEGKSGFRFTYPAGTAPEAGYLLLSRYDGDARRSYVELYDLNAQAMLHRWAPDTDAAFAQAQFQSADADLTRDKTSGRLLYRAPFVTEKGEIVFQSHTPLMKFDACSRLVWMNDTRLFHHALERDDEGFFYTSDRQEPATIAGVNRRTFMDDSIAKVDDAGNLVSERSVADILIGNGMKNLVFGGAEYSDNPIHLNDIQPVLHDGPYWLKGDLFLSLRSPSMIVLYRPSTDKIIWSQIGPWMHQHDVDILDDHRISVFDNAAYEYFPSRATDGYSDVVVVDFASKEVTRPWSAALEAQGFQTSSEGLQTVLADGRLFVEEQNYGRMLEITAGGDLVWEYVNRAEMGRVFRVGWSRLLSAEDGKAVATALAGAKCD